MKSKVFIFITLIALVFSSCASSRTGSGGKKGCGCPSKKGLVGY